MKSVLVGFAIAVVLAIGAYAVLDSRFQMSSTDRFQTEGVRL